MGVRFFDYAVACIFAFNGIELFNRRSLKPFGGHYVHRTRALRGLERWVQEVVEAESVGDYEELPDLPATLSCGVVRKEWTSVPGGINEWTSTWVPPTFLAKSARIEVVAITWTLGTVTGGAAVGLPLHADATRARRMRNVPAVVFSNIQSASMIPHGNPPCQAGISGTKFLR